MPYIKKSRREMMEKFDRARVAGDLNYAVTMLIIDYVKYKGLEYQTINDVRGAVSGALIEFEQRIVRPYEDAKIHDNGDVYQDLIEKLDMQPLLEMVLNATRQSTPESTDR